MDLSVADAIKTMSEAISGLQLTFHKIQEKADLNKATKFASEEINRLTDIEKRLDKIEETNTRYVGKSKSALKMVEVLSGKVERLSATIAISNEKLGAKIENKTHEINQYRRTEEEQKDDTARPLTRVGDDDLVRNGVENVSLKHTPTSKSKESNIIPSNDNIGSKLKNEIKSRPNQFGKESNNMQGVPVSKKSTLEIKQKPKKVKSKSGHKLCLTAANEDNRCSYHQNKDCFHGELLQPVVQRDNKPNFSQPNIVVTQDMDRLSTRHSLEATGKQKGVMTMAQMTERDFDHKQTVHSMNEWAKIATQSQMEVALKIACSLDTISARGNHYIILMDISESMRGEKFNLMTKAAIEYIDGLHTISLRYNIRDNVGLACFGEETKLIVHPIADYDKIKEEIGKLKPGGPSPLAAGLLMALSGLTHCSPKTIGHHDFRPGIIVMTDGVPTRVEALTEDDSTGPIFLSSFMTVERDTEIKSAVTHMSKRGIKIYCIPFGSANTVVMDMMVAETSGKCIPHNQILRMSRMTLTYLDASEIAHKLETTSDINKGMVKIAVLASGGQEHDKFDDITDNVLLLLDPSAQYHGRFKEPRWKAIPLGTRVRRGPNWHWKNQDANMAGTVIGEDNDVMIWVEWDNGHRNCYHYDENTQTFDIKVVNEPRRLVDDLIAVGCKVKRGKDWKFGNQDGGSGNRGTVLRVEQNGKIVVKWDGGRLGIYKFAGDEVFEVEVCEHGRTLNSPDLIIPPQQELATNVSTPTPAAEETPLILPSHKHKNVTSTWQYQNVNGQWTSYDEVTNAKIEKAFNRNTNGKCIIEINDNIYIVKFTTMIQENQKDKTEVPVQRLEEKNEEEDEH